MSKLLELKTMLLWLEAEKLECERIGSDSLGFIYEITNIEDEIKVISR